MKPIRSSGVVIRWLLVASVSLSNSGAAAPDDPAAVAARTWRTQHERAILEEFTRFLSLPNTSKDTDAIARNAEALTQMMRARGITPQLLSEQGSNPVVFGEIRTPGATRTLVFYAHYDGQPAGEGWASPPFSPTMRGPAPDDRGPFISLSAGQPIDPEARIYARSAADDKDDIMALLAALDAIRSSALPFRSNIKFVFDGEEEMGSPHLERIVAAHRELFAGDLWLICDGGSGDRPAVVFGARGYLGATITVYGANRDLHSGLFGNWAPNPALGLVRLLASMKDDNGHVLVKGFYDGVVPLTESERQAIKDAPPMERGLADRLGLGSTEGAPASMGERLALPALNIKRLETSGAGIPSKARATLDVRLVMGMDHRQTARQLTEHLREQGYFVTSDEPDAQTLRAHPRVARLTFDGGGNAIRTPLDLPIAQAVIRTIERVRGPVVRVPSMGGSLPLDLVERVLGAHMVVIPLANPDAHIHSTDENLRVGNLWDGIEQAAALLLMDVNPAPNR
jgi:acetylornithine deacetylase/succinyl-diaminopimelate desuccinylase-like protein